MTPALRRFVTRLHSLERLASQQALKHLRTGAHPDVVREQIEADLRNEHGLDNRDASISAEVAMEMALAELGEGQKHG